MHQLEQPLVEREHRGIGALEVSRDGPVLGHEPTVHRVGSTGCGRQPRHTMGTGRRGPVDGDAGSVRRMPGIPHDALVFYEQLEADNTKVFWEANRDRYKHAVREPIGHLTGELADYGEFHLFRPHNDLRFSKNKPPYKTHQGAYTESEGGAGYYLQLSAKGLMCGTGYYAMAKDQLERFRTAVAADRTGGEIEEIVATLTKRGYTVGAIDELKSAPRGYPKDHPRIELIRRKGLMVSKDLGAPKWLYTKQVTSKIRQTWDGATDMNAWLDAHVGPSVLEPDGFFV